MDSVQINKQTVEFERRTTLESSGSSGSLRIAGSDQDELTTNGARKIIRLVLPTEAGASDPEWRNSVQNAGDSRGGSNGRGVSARLTNASAKVLSQKLYSRPVVRRGAAV